MLHTVRAEVGRLLTFPDQGRGWVLKAATATARLVREWQPDLVVSTGPPHSVHLAAGLGIRGHGVPWIVDLRDPWMTPAHLRSRAGWAGGLSRVLEKRTFRAATAVLTTTPELRDALGMTYSRTRIMCLPNGVDARELPERSPTRSSGLGVIHLGTVYYNRDAVPVIRAFARFLAAKPQAASAGSSLRFIGTVGGDYRARLQEVVAELHLGNHVELVDPLPRREALGALASSHMALVLAQGQGLMIPAKLYESVAMGIPTLVVTEPGSATAREATELGAAVHGPEDVDGMATAMALAWTSAGTMLPVIPDRLDHAWLAGKLEQIMYSVCGSKEVGNL
jgi:glycosyltransferase involved in cell wall biosynthesis